ncbi:prolyl oligopeptidase family serine peptidase [Roseimarinus sediminis]|uniref:prolyl oligopeptidase family serine peptidase n=1 Tax=Roseimarinus sediminis TaxID=1610899 RepID=UPI003D191132
MSCSNTRIEYPETRKEAISDQYFETEVSDPYRWLEDDQSEETGHWVDAQNEVTFAYLYSLPGRDKIKQRLSTLWNYPRSGVPFNKSGRWFVFKNNGLQNQDVLYTMEQADGEQQLLLDPNTLSSDGTVAFAGMDVTPDGRYMVYQIARSGSDWNEIYVIDLLNKVQLNDHVRWVKFSGIACYENGFFYSAYNEPLEGSELSESNKEQKIYFHELGTAQTDDRLVFSNPQHPDRMYGASLDENRKLLIITESESTSGNGLFVQHLGQKNSEPLQLCKGFDYDYIPVEFVGGKLLVMTNDGAPRYRLVAIDPSMPEKEHWVELIAEKEHTMESVSYYGNQLLSLYMADAKSKLEVFDESGNYLHDIDLPGISSVGSIRGTFEGDEVFISYSSYNTPTNIVKYNLNNKQSTEWFRPEIQFNPDDFVVKQEFYQSKDGTQVPVFIAHKKGIVPDGSNPALLYGYGGFNISLTPSFSTSVLYYLEQGGVYAVANLRGGGEYGEAWHKAGTLMNKQNVFDDFIAAAEYLIASGYTKPDKLAIRGGSNGGLLVGAVTNQRPDLFKVALPAVGVMDMLRYHRFTIGYAWASDYGRSDDSPEMFNYLYAYSPYHNVESKAYPAILATTADHDDRVVPAHTFKYMARMQELNTGKLPALIRIDKKAGHGSGKPTSKLIEEYTDLYSFVFYHTGINPE